eukprot:TRINITY_DN61688_c0_g1_i1.p1 TRINITY_DN61688_c0_g1~~TRINITY_DN61688_c0_g1_i1.p1  ORF type:complete len:435 (+),score=42.70 TRINITY_DN61688_c0_g1_i1:40-1305(+)
MADEQIEEDRRINEEYKIWKKNTPFLYDLVLMHALEWPSLTVQWLPEKNIQPEQCFSKQKLLLGTHTSGDEQNYLLVAETQLPLPKTEIDIRRYDDNDIPAGGFGANGSRIELKQKINHDGEVNLARYMPLRPQIVATKTVSSHVFIFDLESHPEAPEPDDHECRPALKLRGHRREGYGLEWNPKKLGLICSGSDDHLICLWDIAGNLDRRNGEMQDPLVTYDAHSDIVADVSWHPIHECIFASVSDDKSLRTWDTRIREKPQETVENAHSREVNAVAFNPFSQFALATGSADKSVALWDIRNLKEKLHSFLSHEEEVFSVQWAPFNETILASSSADRRICFWDISKIRGQQSEQDNEDGPPELLFIHAGHTSKVSDMCWNRQQDDDWVVASVAEDNILQIWRMAENIYNDDDDFENEEEV